MDDRDRADAVAEGFGALANPVRVAILLALADTRQPDWDHRGMSYSDLRTAVDVADGGRFNYHLDELRGQYVVGDDGHYWLTAQGSRVVDAIYAGTFDESPARTEGELATPCGRCGSELRVEVERGILRVECPTHGVAFDMQLAPNAVVGRDPDELAAWAVRRSAWYYESVGWGVCPHCSGRFETGTFERVRGRDELRQGTSGEDDVALRHDCRRCSIAFRVSLRGYVLTTTPVRAFLFAHGADPVNDPTWQRSVDARGATAVADDLAIVTLVVGDGDRLDLAVDETLTVRDYQWTYARGRPR